MEYGRGGLDDRGWGAAFRTDRTSDCLTLMVASGVRVFGLPENGNKSDLTLGQLKY